MLDDLAGKRTGERIQVLRERRGLSRPVLAGLLHWLEQAYQISMDSVRYSPTARQMTSDAVDHGGPLISRRARSLAGSVGLPL